MKKLTLSISCVFYLCLFTTNAWTDIEGEQGPIDEEVLFQDEKRFYFKELSGELDKETGLWNKGPVHQVRDILSLFETIDKTKNIPAQRVFLGNEKAKTHVGNDLPHIAFGPYCSVDKDETKPWIVMIGSQHGDEIYSSESIVQFSIFIRDALVKNSDSELKTALAKVNLLLIPVANVDKRLYLEYISDHYAGRIVGSDSASRRFRCLQLLKKNNYFRKNIQGIDRDSVKLVYSKNNGMNLSGLLDSVENWGLTREEIVALGIENPSETLVSNYRDSPRPNFLKETWKGIDLNRNWETNWKEDLGGEKGADHFIGKMTPQYFKYPGASKQNATETKNIEKLLETIVNKNSPLRLVVDVHTGLDFVVTRSSSFIQDKAKNAWLNNYNFNEVTWRQNKLSNPIQTLGIETGNLEAHAVNQTVGLSSKYSIGMELGTFHIEPLTKVEDGQRQVVVGTAAVKKVFTPFFRDLTVQMSK